MGFMDKLKSMASAITGGSADVTVEIVEPRLDRPFTVNVQAKVGDNEVKIDKVYLKVAGIETVRLSVDMPAAPAATQGNQTAGTARANASTQTKEVSRTANTHQETYELDGAQTLSADETYTWSCEVILPPDARPTYHGIHAKHEWKLMAGLSAFGNDPDSGWQIIDM